MEKIKKLSAALIAMSMACGMMASCGSETTDDTSKADETAATSAAEDTAGDAESEAEGDGEADTESTDDSASADFVAYQPQTEFEGYDAFLMFTDLDWLWCNMNHSGNVHSDTWDDTAANYGYGIDADIVGDGEYTVSITSQSMVGDPDGFVNPQMSLDGNVPTGGNAGVTVFCVDIVGLMDGTEVSGYDDDGNWVNTEATEQKLVEGDNHYSIDTIGDYKASDINVTVTSIKVDGEEVDFDASKILCGNIEDNNNRYRIEIYNAYGKTANDPTIDPMTFAFTDSLEVTFTIEGLGEVKTFPEVEPYAAGAVAAAESAADSIDETGDDASVEEDAAAEDETAAE